MENFNEKFSLPVAGIIIDVRAWGDDTWSLWVIQDRELVEFIIDHNPDTGHCDILQSYHLDYITGDGEVVS